MKNNNFSKILKKKHYEYFQEFNTQVSSSAKIYPLFHFLAFSRINSNSRMNSHTSNHYYSSQILQVSISRRAEKLVSGRKKFNFLKINIIFPGIRR